MQLGIARLTDAEGPPRSSTIQALVSRAALVALVVGLVGVVLVLATVALPGDLSSPLNSTLLALGVTLVTSSTISLLAETYLRTQVVDLVINRVTEILPAQTRVREMGLEAFGVDRVDVDFGQVWRSAEGALRIVGFSANDILSPHLIPIALDRLGRESGFSVMVLLLNPWCATSTTRSHAPCYSAPEDYLRRVWAVITELQAARRRCREQGIDPARLELRLYDGIPSLSCVIDDVEALVTPTLHSRPGGSSPYFMVRRTSGAQDLYGIYREHFEALWDDSRPVGDDLAALHQRTLHEEQERSATMPRDLAEWNSRLNEWSSA